MQITISNQAEIMPTNTLAVNYSISVQLSGRGLSQQEMLRITGGLHRKHSTP